MTKSKEIVFTKEELEAKIAATEKNKLIPEQLKGLLIRTLKKRLKSASGGSNKEKSIKSLVNRQVKSIFKENKIVLFENFSDKTKEGIKFKFLTSIDNSIKVTKEKKKEIYTKVAKEIELKLNTKVSVLDNGDIIFLVKQEGVEKALTNLHDKAKTEVTHEGKNKLTLPKGWGFKK